jgi:hypothetical protein
MRKLVSTLTAALAAAAAVPAAAGADPGPSSPPTVQRDSALRPSALEYAVMLAAHPAIDPAARLRSPRKPLSQVTRPYDQDRTATFLG